MNQNPQIDIGDGYMLLLGETPLVVTDEYRLQTGSGEDVRWTAIPDQWAGRRVGDIRVYGALFRRKCAATVQVEDPGPGHVEKLPDGRVVLSAAAWGKIRSSMVSAYYRAYGPMRGRPLGEADELLLWLHAATEASGYELEQLT